MRDIYVMYDGQHNIVGFAYTMGEDPVLLTSLFVRASYRGKGHGRALLEYVCKDADREHQDILLSVDPDPKIDPIRLTKMYLDFGFETLEDGATMLRKWHERPKVKIPQQMSPTGRINQKNPLWQESSPIEKMIRNMWENGPIN